jgi:hypothetical protein
MSSAALAVVDGAIAEAEAAERLLQFAENNLLRADETLGLPLIHGDQARKRNDLWIGGTAERETAIGQKSQNAVLFPSRSRAGAKMKRVFALASCKDGKRAMDFAPK